MFVMCTEIFLKDLLIVQCTFVNKSCFLKIKFEIDKNLGFNLAPFFFNWLIN